MTEVAVGPSELEDAVAVHSACRKLDKAIAHLAASPMDVEAAAEMRAILDSPRLAEARAAVARLANLPRPRTHRTVHDLAERAAARSVLSVVPGGAG
jgi:hypothetical protein